MKTETTYTVLVKAKNFVDCAVLHDLVRCGGFEILESDHTDDSAKELKALSKNKLMICAIEDDDSVKFFKDGKTVSVGQCPYCQQWIQIGDVDKEDWCCSYCADSKMKKRH